MINISWVKCKSGSGRVEDLLKLCTNNDNCLLKSSENLGYDYAINALRSKLNELDETDRANIRKDRIEMIMLAIPVPDNAEHAIFAALVLDEVTGQLGIKRTLFWSICKNAYSDNPDDALMYVAFIPEVEGRLSAKLLCTRVNIIRLNKAITARCHRAGFNTDGNQKQEIGEIGGDDSAAEDAQEGPEMASGSILDADLDKCDDGDDKTAQSGDLGRSPGDSSSASAKPDNEGDGVIHKSNYLVMSSYGTVGKTKVGPAEQYQYNLTALRMLDVYLSKIDSNNPKSRYVEFTKSEFCAIMGLHEKTATAGLVTAVKQLKYVDVIFPVQYSDKSGIEMMTLFPNARIINASHKSQVTIALECNERLVDMFFDFENGDYTTYALENIMRIKSKYSFVLYNRLKMHLYKNEGRWIATPNELSALFDIDTSSGLKYINRIVKRCQEEINAQTDISFEFETLLHWRNATAIRFDITDKKKSLLSESSSAEQMEDA